MRAEWCGVSLRDLAKDYVDFLEAVVGGPVDCTIGISGYGEIAARAAAARPDLFRCMVFSSVPACISRSMVETLVPLIRNVLPEDLDTFMNFVISFFFPPDFVASPVFDRLLRYEREKHAAEQMMVREILARGEDPIEHSHWRVMFART